MFKDMFGNNRVKICTHTHTTLSDGHKTPEEAIALYKSRGYDAIAITDHWKQSENYVANGMTVLSGCEFNFSNNDAAAGVFHILGIGMTEKIDLVKPDFTSEEDNIAFANTLVDSIHRAGGIAVLAHPAWSLNTYNQVSRIKGIDATEIFNTVSDVHESDRPYAGIFVDTVASRGIIYPLLAADDTHYYDGEDECKSYTMLNTGSADRESILDAIKRGDFYSSQGPELHVRREGGKIVVNCSPVDKISFLSNVVWANGNVLRGENLTYGEMEIKPPQSFVRVEVTDKNGLCAWSNIIKL